MQHVETTVKSIIFGLLVNRPNPVMHTTVVKVRGLGGLSPPAPI